MPRQARHSKSLRWHAGQSHVWRWLHMNSCHSLDLGPDVTCMGVVGLGNSVPSLFNVLSNLQIITLVLILTITEL